MLQNHCMRLFGVLGIAIQETGDSTEVENTLWTDKGG